MGRSEGAARRPTALVALVLTIAASQVAASQVSARLVREAKLPAFFLMWFSTSWNLLLAVPLLMARPRQAALGHWTGSGPSLVLWVCPFYLLWAGANTLYTQGLALLSPPLVTAVTVAELAPRPSRRPLTLRA